MLHLGGSYSYQSEIGDSGRGCRISRLRLHVLNSHSVPPSSDILEEDCRNAYAPAETAGWDQI